MTKDPRNPNVWTNPEIEQDSAGYLAAQEAFGVDQAREQARRREQADREAHVRRFSNRAEGEADFEQRRLERESEAAALEDEAARRQQHGAVMGRL